MRETRCNVIRDMNGKGMSHKSTQMKRCRSSQKLLMTFIENISEYVKKAKMQLQMRKKAGTMEVFGIFCP